MDGIRSGAYWARSRNLQFLRFIHRLDADTSGVLLLAKSPGAVSAYSRMFEDRQIKKNLSCCCRGCSIEKELGL